MATINGTIKGASLVSSTFSGVGAREVWLLACSFGVYSGAGDTASVTGVGAGISARARDGRTRTLRAGVTAHAGRDTAAQAVYATGASVQAMTVSSDDLTGNLSNAAGTELSSATASDGVGVFAFVDVS